MKNIVIGIVGGIVVGILGIIGYVQFEIAQIPDEFHEHADFAVFLNGEQYSFARPEFMTDTACGITLQTHGILVAQAHGSEGEEEGSMGYYENNVHLHDMIGSTVHVHQEGITWHNFFDSLGLTFDDNLFIDHQGNEYRTDDKNGFMFFVNGAQVDTLENRDIRNFDEVLISYGPLTRTVNDLYDEMGHVTNRACEQSGGCEHRGIDIIESCTAQVPLPWILQTIGYEK